MRRRSTGRTSAIARPRQALRRSTRAFRGRRIGTEAARLFQRHLLVDLDFHRVELQIYGFNERAIAHAEQCGYVREGVKRKAYLKHGEWQDAVLFSLLQEELPDVSRGR